jgi:hypothetical protein
LAYCGWVHLSSAKDLYWSHVAIEWTSGKALHRKYNGSYDDTITYVTEVSVRGKISRYCGIYREVLMTSV